MHAVVALLEDPPAEGLVRGQVGTVVENWAPGVYEVEFSDATRQGVRYGRIGDGNNSCVSVTRPVIRPHKPSAGCH